MSVYRRVLPYAVAIGSTAIAICLSIWLDKVIFRTVGAFFYIAIAASTWYGGLRPGMVATVLSSLALVYYILPPTQQFRLESGIDILRVVLFTSVSLIITLLSANLRESRQKVEQLSRQLVNESSDRLRTALNAAQMGMWDWNIETGVITWSPEHEQLFGLPLGSFDGKYETFDERLYPDDREGLKQAIAHALQNQVPYCHEYRIVWTDGSVHWVEGRGLAFYNSDGQPVQMTGTIMAIDARKQAETALLERESLLSLFVQSAPAGIAMLDREMRYLMASQRWVDMYSLNSVESVMNRSHYDLFPDIPERWRQIHQRCLAGAIEKCDEDLFVRADGTSQWIFWEIHPWHLATGEIGGMIIFSVDISDRKAAELALQQSEQTNRAIIETIPDLLIQMDRQGHNSSIVGGAAVRVQYPSAPAPESSAPESFVYTVLPPDLTKQRLCYCNQAIESGTLQVYEQALNLEGESHYEEVRIAPLNGQEALVMVRDITDRKRAEAILQSLMESTAAVTGKDFFSTLAQQLMLALKVQHVLVTQLVGDRLQTLAYWKDGKPQPETTFALADAPCCANAIEQGQFYCSTGLQQRFPEYPFIQALQADSYLGIPLTSTQGQRVGNLCILDNKPMWNVQWAEAFLRIFSTRATAELERQQATEALEQLNQELEARIEERTNALRQSEAELSAIFNQAAVGIYLATLEGQYLKVNQKLCDILGYTQEALLTQNLQELCHPEDINQGEQEWQRLYSGTIDSFSIDKRYVHKDGSIAWINLTVSLICQGTDKGGYSIGVVEDISERKRAEAQIQASLEEKNVLLQEIHHRVKNNLQMISSLLRLQANTISDLEILALLQESQNRVQSMALIHEKLYQSPNLARINFAEYTQDLTRYLSSTYSINADRVQINLEVESIEIDVQIANPLGLILNELLTNALKYAFPHDRAGTISIQFHHHASNQYELGFSDNGVGLPEGLDITTARSLGLKLIQILTRQLRGTLTVNRKYGTSFNLTFAAPQ